MEKRLLIVHIFAVVISLPKGALNAQVKTCPKRYPEWRDLGGEYCYLLEKSTSPSWELALQRCLEKGGSLASFHSSEEVDRVRGLFRSENHENNPYIGLYQTVEGVLHWTDETPVDYQKWGSSDLMKSQHFCTTIGFYTGGWYPGQCNITASHICSTPKRSPCFPNICKNGGVCPEDGLSDLHPCTCRHGFRGFTCYEKILCDESPCRHGGVCKQPENDVFSCSCRRGFKGSMCEERILCNEFICRNGGNCTQDGENGVFRCSCAPGFSGLTCEKRLKTGDTTSNMATVDVVLLCLCVILMIALLIGTVFIIGKFRVPKGNISTRFQPAYKNNAESRDSGNVSILHVDEDNP